MTPLGLDAAAMLSKRLRKAKSFVHSKEVHYGAGA